MPASSRYIGNSVSSALSQIKSSLLKGKPNSERKLNKAAYQFGGTCSDTWRTDRLQLHVHRHDVVK